MIPGYVVFLNFFPSPLAPLKHFEIASITVLAVHRKFEKLTHSWVSQSDFMSLVISYLCTVACYHMTFKLPLTLPAKIERLENKTHKPLTAIRNSFNTAKWIVIV